MIKMDSPWIACLFQAGSTCCQWFVQCRFMCQVRGTPSGCFAAARLPPAQADYPGPATIF
jgi:hypothetical protein